MAFWCQHSLDGSKREIVEEIVQAAEPMGVSVSPLNCLQRQHALTAVDVLESAKIATHAA